jgi:hypothetical protein
VTYGAIADRIRELFDIEREQAKKSVKNAAKKTK